MPETYVNLRAPAAEHHGVLCLRVSDFVHHKNYIVHRVLPRRGRIVVTAWGHPDFEVIQPELTDYERVDWGGSKWVEVHDGRNVAPVSYFMDRLGDYVAQVLPSVPDRRILLTRYGWPDFVAAQPRWRSTTKVQYEPVVDPDAEREEAADE